jgi:hypothetical protein
MITRRNLLAGAAAQALSRRTNVVFIFTDDHGSWALNSDGCTDLHTPNLDRLAREGARFTRASVARRHRHLRGILPQQLPTHKL